MRWLVALFLIGVSCYFLYTWQKHLSAPPGQEVSSLEALTKIPETSSISGEAAKSKLRKSAEPVKTATPDLILSEQDIKKIRSNAASNDPAVRWTAIELLYTMRDSEGLALAQKAATDDVDPDNRLKAVRLLRTQEDVITLQKLGKSLQDSEIEVRLAALRALGDIGDPASARWITNALNDPEPDVRTEALRTIGRIQDKRRAEYNEIAQELKRQYEDAVHKAQQKANE